MFPNPGSFHSKYFIFIFVASSPGVGKKGEREIGVEWWVGRLTSCCADKWWLASPPRRAEQQIAVASDGGALTRVSPRRPSISPLLPPLSSSEGNASELLEITLMERAKWQSAHSSTLIWNSLYQKMYLFVYFSSPKGEERAPLYFLFFFFSSRLSALIHARLDTP